ncbi:MAG TPA: tetratricopeptide repeat protein, partial [Terriglobales bacterium]
ICLALGLALGYLFRGSQTQATTASAATSTQTGQTGMPPAMAAQAAQGQGQPPQMPSLEQMKAMALKKAEPLIAQLKTDPNNADLLKQVARIYESTHQFKDAADYLGKAVAVNPKDVATRGEMASCLYYSGDVDGAIDQLQQALKVDPKDANSLFNLGMIRWKGKNDSKGAVEAWDQLLKSNPNLENAKKSQVQKLMAEAKQMPVS